jgi:structure-specific endonuclease subunit SLX1
MIMNPDEKEEPVVDEDPSFSTNKSFFVYLLESSTKKATYVGATINLDRRLRQHNKEIKGGAIYTGTRVERGEQWRRVCHVQGFPDWQSALQFEWRWKQLTRKIKATHHKTSLDRRMAALTTLLNLERSTTKAIPFSEWPQKPEVIKNI